MTWEAAAAAVPEVAAAAGDAVGTAAVERGAASCSFSTSSSNGRVAAATCAPSHASHSLQTVANCVRHSLGCRSRRRRRRRVVFNRRYNGGDGGGKHKFLEWPLRHCVVVVVVALTPNHICGVRHWSRHLTLI